MNVIKEEKLLKLKSYNGIFILHPNGINYIETDCDYACIYFKMLLRNSFF
jgi:hypothetical protein